MPDAEEPSKPVRERRPAALLFPALLVVCTVLLWAPRFAGPIDLRYDAGVYYILGTSLAKGDGYRLLSEPGHIAAIQYPPLLPTLVAAEQWMLGTDDPDVVGQALRYTYFLFSVLLILAVYAMSRQDLTAAYAFVVGLITCFYLFTYFLADLLFAEVPFCLASALFVFCGRRSERWYDVALTALLGAAAFLLRTAGIALLLAWVGEAVFRQRWRHVVLRAVVSLIPIVTWQAYIADVTSSVEYASPAYEYQRASYQYYNVSYLENLLLVDPFIPELGRVSPQALAGRIVENLAVMPLSLGEGVSATKSYWDWGLYDVQQAFGIKRLPGDGVSSDNPNSWLFDVQRYRRIGHPILVLVPLALLGWLVLSGLGVLCARRQWLVPLYVGGSLALITLTPWPGQFSRYVMPLTPFIALALVALLTSIQGLLGSVPRIGRFLSVTLVAGVIAVVMGSQLFSTWKTFALCFNETYEKKGRRFFYDEPWRSFERSVAWLKHRVTADDIVASVAPHLVYLETGAQAILPPMEVDPAEAQRLLDAVPVDYVIADELSFVDTSKRYMRPVIERNPERWQLVFAVPGTETQIYRRVGKAAPEALPRSEE